MDSRSPSSEDMRAGKLSRSARTDRLWLRSWRILNPPSQHGDGGFGQRERGVWPAGHRGTNGRPIRVGVAVGAVILPHVLFAAETHLAYRPCEGCRPLARGILEENSHRMRAGLVTV